MESKIILIAYLAAIASFVTGLVAVVRSLRESKELENNEILLPQSEDSQRGDHGETNADTKALLPHLEGTPSHIAEAPPKHGPPRISILAPVSRPAGESLKALAHVFRGY